MIPVTAEKLAQYAPVLVNLASHHGLSNLRSGGDHRLIVDIAAGRTYMDVARFELDAQDLLGGAVDVILSGTEGATQADRGALGTGRAA